jgi:hypothetical protein
MQIAALQARIALLSDAQNQITKCQATIASLSAQLTPDNEPDAASLSFAQSQISTASASLQTAATAVAFGIGRVGGFGASASLQTAATAVGVAVAAPVSAQLNTASPVSSPKIGS